MKENTKGKKMQNTKVINELKKQVKGITLIALVVTIIVLLILAGVAISLSIGNNGIFTRAQDAAVRHENASVYEQLQFVIADYQMDDIENNRESEIMSKLKLDGYVNEDNTLNVERLMGKRLNTGRGSLEDGDVYVLEQREETASSVTSDVSGTLKYYLIYYGENNSTSTNLGLAFEGKEELEPTDPSLFVVSEYGAISLKDFDKYYSGNIEWTIENLVIPREVNGREVKFITNTLVKGHNILSIQKNLKSVIIPDTVLAIGYQAFEKCSSLETVKLSNNLEEIDSEAFSECTNLKNLTIPNSVKSIGSGAFYGTPWYESLPDGEIYINKIYYDYKGKMPANTNIQIKTGTIEIADFAFAGCSELINITIPNSVTSIGYNAFNDCVGLTSIKIPDSVTSINNSTFSNCSRLTSVMIPNSVTKIDSSAFRGCSSLASITIPNSVTSISGSAFWGCSSLTSITIPDNVKNIEGSTFYDCSSLTSITIPSSVKSIGSSAFWNCDELNTVYYQGTEEEWKKISIDDYGNDALTNAQIIYNQ